MWSSYPYSPFDLIEQWVAGKFREVPRVETVEGQPVKFLLPFSSPPETWDQLCGRAGFYEVDLPRGSLAKAEGTELPKKFKTLCLCALVRFPFFFQFSLIAKGQALDLRG